VLQEPKLKFGDFSLRSAPAIVAISAGRDPTRIIIKDEEHRSFTGAHGKSSRHPRSDGCRFVFF
jgi:hypothetical protein